MVDRIPVHGPDSVIGGKTAVGISADQLARLEANQRGLYVEALDSITKALETARVGAPETLLADKLRA